MLAASVHVRGGMVRYQGGRVAGTGGEWAGGGYSRSFPVPGLAGPRVPGAARGPLFGELFFGRVGIPFGVPVRPAERVADGHAREKAKDDGGGQGDDDPRVNGYGV